MLIEALQVDQVCLYEVLFVCFRCYHQPDRITVGKSRKFFRQFLSTTSLHKGVGASSFSYIVIDCYQEVSLLFFKVLIADKTFS